MRTINGVKHGVTLSVQTQKMVVMELWSYGVMDVNPMFGDDSGVNTVFVFDTPCFPQNPLVHLMAGMRQLTLDGVSHGKFRVLPMARP